MIRIFAVGDIMGRCGRRVLTDTLDKIRSDYKPDIMLVNGENAAGGFGITKKIYLRLTEELGFDAVTTGNHWHDKREIHNFFRQTERLLLPANMSNVSNEEYGLKILKSKSGVPFAVMNLIGCAFMHEGNKNPFDAANRLLEKIPNDVKVRIVDMHGEATSEKQGMAYHLDGKVSLVYGTHSHVPTADERLINNRLAYITDIGMSGSYDSIIGMEKEPALERLLTGARTKLEPAKNNPWLCAIIVDVDEETGKSLAIQRIRWELNRMEL